MVPSKICGDCSGFCHDVLIEGQKTVCSKAGKERIHTACPKFIPVVEDLRGDATNLDLVANIINNMDDRGLKIFSLLFAGASRTRRMGMRFMQRVYVRYRGLAGSDYLSNFMEAYVMVASKDIVKLVSKDFRCVLTYSRERMPTLYTEEEFEPKRAKMVAQSKLIDPDVESLLSRRFRCEEEYELNISSESLAGELTTIDSVFKSSKIKTRKAPGTDQMLNAVAMAASTFGDGEEEDFVDREDEDYYDEDFDDEEEVEAPVSKSSSRTIRLQG